jgi:hypothetical protein
LRDALVFSISAICNFRNSSGVPPTTSVATSSMDARKSGACTIATMSALSFFTISGGVPAGYPHREPLTDVEAG